MGFETEEKQNSGSVPESSTVRVRRRQTFTSLYRKFRHSGLSGLDSAFNALYICQSNKMYNKKLDAENAGEGFFHHPAGWYKTGCEKVRRAARTKTLKALELVARVLAPLSGSVKKLGKKVDFFGDNSTVTLRRAVSYFKKAAPVLGAVALATLLFFNIYNDSEKTTVIEVDIDGVTMFEVASSRTVEEALERVNTRISDITGEAFFFPHELSFKTTKKSGAKCIDVPAVCEVLLSYTDDYVTEAYGLYIDSSLVAVLEHRSDITSVIETIRLEHMKETGEEEDVANKVEIKYQEYAADDIIDREALLLMLTPVKEEEKTEEEPVITRALLSTGGDSTTLTIDAEASEIESKIAEAVALREEKSDAVELDFAVYYEKTVRENVPYTTRYIEVDDLYENQKIVRTSGRDGTANNTYKIKYVNGVEESRELISQTIIRTPRESVVKIGTKKLPERMTDEENGGKYMINPVPTAYVSDRFGERTLKGRKDYHEGLDLAAWVGTPIFAAASGEVIDASYSSSYGYVVKILHDDGLVSVYAHCSELLVSLGDMVHQGDEIASVGSTGYSFGYHCHFEVISDGVKVDPEIYIYSLE